MKSPVYTIRGVAVAPPKDLGVKQKTVTTAGIVMLDIKSSLRPMTVLFGVEIPIAGGSAELQPGDTIYVAVEHLNAQRWAREVMEIDGQEFVSVPLENVFAIGYTAVRE